jgi:acetyltransferase
MRDIKSYPLLLGHSPVEAIDLDALEDLLVRVSRLVNDWPQIIEIDLNPIIAYPRGVEPPVAVDVRIRLEY